MNFKLNNRKKANERMDRFAWSIFITIYNLWKAWEPLTWRLKKRTHTKRLRTQQINLKAIKFIAFFQQILRIQCVNIETRETSKTGISVYFLFLFFGFSSSLISCLFCFFIEFFKFELRLLPFLLCHCCCCLEMRVWLRQYSRRRNWIISWYVDWVWGPRW